MATDEQKDKLWEKARKARGRNPNRWRRDAYGNLMYKPAFGTQGNVGWEIDHKRPKAKGGSDSPRNLQAINTNENRKKGDQYPYKKRK